MMPFHALAYCSRVVSGITVEQIDRLVEDAASRNLIAGITGVLFCDGLHFLQYIEGPEDRVRLTYLRILNSTSHIEMVELGRRWGGRRSFPDWSMRWIPVEQCDLHIAKSSEWRGLMQRSKESMFQVPTGVDRILSLAEPYMR